jgi:hypothetical protein
MLERIKEDLGRVLGLPPSLKDETT